MSIHAALYHKTHYTYGQPVSHEPHVVRLRPAPHCRTKILGYSQRITGGKHFINWHQDPFSNWNARLVFPDKMKEFCVEVELIVEMAVYNPFDFFLEENAEHFPFAYDQTLKKDLTPFLEPGPLTPKFAAYFAAAKHDILGHLPLTPGFSRVHESEKDSAALAASDPGTKAVETAIKSEAPGNTRLKPGVNEMVGAEKPPLRTIDFLVALNQRLQRDIKYLIRLEPGVQSPEETLSRLSGSCRDTGWLLVQLLRHFGLASRFVSGYLVQLAPDVKSLDGPSGTAIDFTDLHAWCEVYLPGAGWIGLDQTSGLMAGEGHIPLSCTPEPSTAAPVSGVIDKCESKLHHEMKVTRVYESPRVTKPYTEQQWQEIETLGHAIDADLNKHDVRLTMGGEPTFISIDNMDGEEWTFTAVGPEKRKLSGELIVRLKQKFAPGGLLHYGEGKWYPGESLPRWAFGCYWRKDGQAIWKNDSLIADEKTEYGYTAEHSSKFITALATRLGADTKWIMPGYEDPFYHLWKERRLPVNSDSHKKNLNDEDQASRLAKILHQGLDSVIGYVLPMQRSKTDFPVWISGPWFLRSEKLFLTPGDSPMGLRLPLDSLPWVSQSDYPYLNERDPNEERPFLDTREKFRQLYQQVGTPASSKAAILEKSPQREEESKRSALPLDPTRLPQPGESAPWIVRTALCVEVRKGQLRVFMPPVATLEDYLGMITAVEDTAAHLQMPVGIEGYAPPSDYRLSHVKVPPDPGVIEVNLQPAHSWDELVQK